MSAVFVSIQRMSANGAAAIAGDETRLRQILLNLLSNAVKFTDVGEVVVSVTSSALSEDDTRYATRNGKPVHELRFSVRDTGIGIPDAILNKLLDSKAHVSTNGTRGEKGSGLGLKICKTTLTVPE